MTDCSFILRQDCLKFLPRYPAQDKDPSVVVVIVIVGVVGVVGVGGGGGGGGGGGAAAAAAAKACAWVECEAATTCLSHLIRLLKTFPFNNLTFWSLAYSLSAILCMHMSCTACRVHIREQGVLV